MLGTLTNCHTPEPSQLNYRAFDKRIYNIYTSKRWTFISCSTASGLCGIRRRRPSILPNIASALSWLVRSSSTHLSVLRTRAPARNKGKQRSALPRIGPCSTSSTFCARATRSASSQRGRLLRRNGDLMKTASERIRRRLKKDRQMTVISIRIPEDVIEDLKE